MMAAIRTFGTCRPVPDVCSYGETGSDRRAVKAALLTQSRGHRRDTEPSRIPMA